MSRNAFRMLGVCMAVAALVAPGSLRGREQAIVLPPFLVEAPGLTIHWRYAAMPNFEVLSCCPENETREISETFHRAHQVLEVVLPLHFQIKYDVPKTLILYDKDLLPALTRDLLTGERRTNSGRTEGESADEAYRVIDAPLFDDKDALAIFVSVPRTKSHDFTPAALSSVDSVSNEHFSTGSKALTPGYAGFLLSRRTPTVPRWFVAAFTSLYGKMHFAGDKIVISPISWLSEHHTRLLHESPGKLRRLLPLLSLLENPYGDPKTIALRMAEMELFVRWGLVSEKGIWREPFWKFIDRCCREPVSEVVFKECFGFDSNLLTDRLENYLVSRATEREFLRPSKGAVETSIKLPAWEFRDATGGEVARIKGDWERMAADYVAAHTPAVTQPYLAQARRTLRRAYERGDRDPRFLAVLGLCESDAGNGADAREFLEKAVQSGVVRPQAYLELARLRFDAFRAARKTSDDKFNESQTREVLEILQVARRQAPPLREVYDLVAEVWAQSAVGPERLDLAVLDEGIAFFPQHAILICQTAALYLTYGDSAKAAKLVDVGLGIDGSDAARRNLIELRERLPR